MITITNVGPFNQSPFGERDYEICINNQLITKFKHKREKGLAECLWEAAKAVERQKLEAFYISFIKENQKHEDQNRTAVGNPQETVSRIHDAKSAGCDCSASESSCKATQGQGGNEGDGGNAQAAC